MTRFTMYAMLVVMLLNAGCTSPLAAENVEPSPSPTSTPFLLATPSLPTVVADEWTITMTHSGGIMGLMRSMEISSDGSYTAVDERANKTVSGQLSFNELATLKKFVSIFVGADLQKPVPSGCADCFIYDLEIHSGEKSIVIQLDDISLPKSSLEQVVRLLLKIMDSALK